MVHLKKWPMWQMWHFSFSSRPKMKKWLRDNLWLPLKLKFLPSKITKIMVPFFNYEKSISPKRVTWHLKYDPSYCCHITYLREGSFYNTWTKVIILFCVYSTCDWCDVFVTGLDKIMDFLVMWYWSRDDENRKHESWSDSWICIFAYLIISYVSN